MKKYSIIPAGLVLSCLASLNIARADYTNNLLVGWTFNNGTLTSDMGSIATPATFTQATNLFANNTVSFDNAAGSVSLGTGAELYAAAINSTDHPELLNAVTIWVRMKFDGALAQTGVYGLLKGSTPLSGASGLANYSAVFEVVNTTSRLGRFVGTTDAGTGFGRGSGFPTIPATGYVNVAIRVSDLGNNSSPFGANVGGVANDGTWGGTTANLQSVAALALGRIKSDAGTALTFDEVRVYSQYLTDAQIASISAVAAIPEPDTMALLFGLAGIATAFGRRPRRK